MGCQTVRTKKELVRVVRTPDGQVVVDVTGKKPGRGAYICPSRKCLEMARKAKRLERALEVEITQAVYEELMREVERLSPGEATRG